MSQKLEVRIRHLYAEGAFMQRHDHSISDAGMYGGDNFRL